jgi:hypothetical protein
MTTYRCYFGHGENAPRVQTIECDQDGEAVEKAARLLDSTPEHFGLEVWKDSRLLARLSRGKLPASQDRAV